MELEEKFKYVVAVNTSEEHIALAIKQCVEIAKEYADETYLNFIRYSTGWDKGYIEQMFYKYKQHLKNKGLYSKDRPDI